MVAHEILQGKYANLLMLCLDSVDSQWLKNIDISTWSWSKLEKEFVAHFQHPNAVTFWQEKICKLRMDSTGVQRYTNQFIRLAQKLHWQLKGEVAIYQYKEGLPEWLADRVTTAEASYLVNGEEALGVEELGQIALSIEANSRRASTSSKQTPAPKVPPKSDAL